MKTPLAIIMTEFFNEPVKAAISELSGEFDFSIYYYHDFNDVLDAYRSIPPHIRGVAVSGPHPEHIITKAYPNDGRVVRAFMNDPTAVYKKFLRIFHNNPGITTDRVFFDSFHVIGIDLDEYLFGEATLSWDTPGDKYFEERTLEQVIQAEKEIYQTHVRLWRANLIDISLTRFSSLVSPLQDAGVNVEFLYPTREYIQAICRGVASQVQIAVLQDKQPAVLLVTARGYGGGQKHVAQAKMDQLGKKLHLYAKNFDPEAIIAPAAFGFEVITNRQAVDKSTGGMQQCWVQSSLAKKLDFALSVGYGIGLTLPQARLNAVDAGREALQHPGQSYLINEQDELIGPLKTGAPMVVSRKASPLVREVSSKTGLSSLTVQRVLSVMKGAEDGYTTSQMVAQRLSVTQRSANRFLQALLSSGQAEIIGMRRATTKGRPERLYRLLIEEKAAE